MSPRIPTAEKESTSKSTPKANQPLTMRQRQVVELVARGMSNKEIASELNISEGTVKQHIFAIFRIFNVTSRAKLALLGQRLSPQVEVARKNAIAAPKKSMQYSWRLISALAVNIPELLIADPQQVVERNQQLMHLRHSIERMVLALDGSSMPMPDGGVLVWFGHPTAHIDDPQRASILAQGIRKQITAELGLGLGIATVAEVVPSDSGQLISAAAFQKALKLGKKSSELGLTLANALTQRLCKSSVSWLELRPTQDKVELPISKVREVIYAISTQPSQHGVPSHVWGGLRFLSAVFDTAKNGIAQWVSVESWPPTLANSLIDAIGMDAVASGFVPIRLHVPSSKRQDAVLTSLLTQVEMAISAGDLPVQKSDFILDRLLSILWKISSQTPIVLQVYGIHSLAAFKAAIGPRGIDRLVGLKVLIVLANLRDSAKPKTSIRVLGARPDNLVFTRVHTMVEPELDLLPEGVMVDMQAMVDDLSGSARQIIFAAAESPGLGIDALLPRLSIPRPVLQMALQELSNAGLITPRDDNHFDFRDALTITAITQLKKIAIAA